MARFSNQEFLEKCHIDTLIAYTFNQNKTITFDCFDRNAIPMRYTIDRADVLAELDKRYGRSPTAKKKIKRIKKAKKKAK